MSLVRESPTGRKKKVFLEEKAFFPRRSHGLFEGESGKRLKAGLGWKHIEIAFARLRKSGDQEEIVRMGRYPGLRLTLSCTVLCKVIVCEIHF